MMKELQSRFLLTSNWQCTSADRKAKNKPTLLVAPSVDNISPDSIAGIASIRDSDGAEWKCTYSTSNELNSIIKDFNLLTAESIKSRGGGS